MSAVEDAELLEVLEAILMVTDHPAAPSDLASALGADPQAVEAGLHRLADDYDGRTGGRRRGFQLLQTAGGWRIYSREDHHEAVSAVLTAGQQSRLSQAALETLAVIAYQQPVSRGRISAVRGVNVDGVVRTLLMRGLIVEAGTETGTGAQLLATSAVFLEQMGLRSLDELPDIAPLLPEQHDLSEHGDLSGPGGLSEHGDLPDHGEMQEHGARPADRSEVAPRTPGV